MILDQERKADFHLPKKDTERILNRVHIARISTVPFFVVAQLSHQIEKFVQLGASVTSVTSDGPDIATLTAINGVRCVAIDIPRSISPWRDVVALFKLIVFFRRAQIQIAHSTTPKAGLLTALAAFVAGVPVRLHTFTGQPWVNMRGIKRGLMCGSDKVISLLSSHCYADSASQRQFLIEQKIVNGNHISVIGAGSLAGVDIRRFDKLRFSQAQCMTFKKALGVPDESKVLLFIGRITADKGVCELLQAFDALKQAGSSAHLIFVGLFDADSGVAGSISQHQIDAIRDTHVVGYSDAPEQYLSIADILCLPSYREGFGTVVIEAAAMGVPTVGTAIYGLSDAIVNGETGLLVPPRDAALLAGAIDTLLVDESLRCKMGAAAMQRARALFDADQVNGQVAQEYVRLLQKACAKK